MNARKRERLRALEGQLMGAQAWALARGDRRWWRSCARRIARTRQLLAWLS